MGRREQKKQQKRERLLKEGLRLFTELGYDRTSIEQIAAASEIARGTFYLYYPDKHALFAELMQEWFTPMMEVFGRVQEEIAEAETGARALAVYQRMGNDLALIGIANSQEVLLAQRESRRSGEAGDGLRTRELAIIDIVTQFTQTAKDRGLIQIGDPRLTVLVVFGAVERLTYEMLLGQIEDITGAASQVVSMFGSAMGIEPKDLATMVDQG